MDVITKYPIRKSNSVAQSKSFYRSTYSGADGDLLKVGGAMEVKTSYPIVYTTSNSQSKDEYRGTYSGAFGDGWLTTAAGRERRAKRRAERQRTGNTFGNKIGKFAQSDLGKGLLGKLGGGGDGMGAPVDTGLPMAELPPEGMSTGMKIGLAVGGVAVLGIAAYFLMRKK
jgi:hypothetical protein